MRIYTRKGDDGTTGLLYGGRVQKSSPRIEVNGDIDEAQATLGLARAEAAPDSDVDVLLVSLERDLYCVMGEVATAPENRHKLNPGTTLVTPEMVTALEGHIDDLGTKFDMPTEFVIPGQNRMAAALDVARTVVRRAERRWTMGMGETEHDATAEPSDTQVGAYLNRLSDLLWAMARWQEGDRHLASKEAGRSHAEDNR